MRLCIQGIVTDNHSANINAFSALIKITLYISLSKPAAFNTTFITARHCMVNENQAVKGERYSEKKVFLEFT